MDVQHQPNPGHTRRGFLTAAGGVTAGVAAGAAFGGSPATSPAHAAAGRPSRILIKGGCVVSMDPDIGVLPSGDVLIKDGAIIAVGKNLSAHSAEKIDARGMIVTPGFVDSHGHYTEILASGLSADGTPESHRNQVIGRLPGQLDPDAVYQATLAAVLGSLNAGCTTVVDADIMSATLDEAKAAVRALAATNVRALYAYSTPQSFQNDPNSPPSLDDLRVIAEYIRRHSPEGLMGPHVGIVNPNNRPPEVLDKTIKVYRLAREELGASISVHAGLGPSINTPYLLADADILDYVMFAAGSAFGLAEMELIKAHNGRVITTTKAEMQVKSPPPVMHALAVGLPVIVAGDSRAFDAPSLTTQVSALLRYLRSLGVDSQTSADGLAYITTNPAEALGMSRRIGSLTPGKRGDVVLLRMADHPDTMAISDPYVGVIHMSTSEHVDTVIVDGKILKRDGRLVGHNMRKIARDLRATQRRLGLNPLF